MHAAAEAAQRHAEARTAAIAARTYSDEHFAPSPIDPATEPPGYIFTRKIRSFGCPDALGDTHDRLFARHQVQARIDPERAQRLRNINTRGKSYDIISGVEIQVGYRIICM